MSLISARTSNSMACCMYVFLRRDVSAAVRHREGGRGRLLFQCVPERAFWVRS